MGGSGGTSVSAKIYCRRRRPVLTLGGPVLAASGLSFTAAVRRGKKIQ